MANGWLNQRKTFCLITGGSRGLGRSLAVKFAQHFGPDSLVVLIATKLKQLEECSKEIVQVAAKVKVGVHSYDLGKPNNDDLHQLITASLNTANSKAEDFEQAIIVHNAATVGSFKLAENASDPEEWAAYLQMNLISAVCLNSVFLKTFNSQIKHRLIINITSFAACQPMLSAAFYNTGKAARDHFFLTLAKEDPSLSVLSYSPGILKTDMSDSVYRDLTHSEAKTNFQNAYSAGCLTCDQTVDKLCDILNKGEFKSGIRVDYHGRNIYCPQ